MFSKINNHPRNFGLPLGYDSYAQQKSQSAQKPMSYGSFMDWSWVVVGKLLGKDRLVEDPILTDWDAR